MNELLQAWFGNLSEEEASAWMEAYVEDLQGLIRDLLIVQRAALAVSESHPGSKLGEAMEVIRQKPCRTLAEAEGLEAFDRIKYKKMK
ncbi:MAG: hypothetical protein HY822_07820 [Acidobacteria bacterium]|nr:hypothetical protein [Acidobacteriota bacterium]